MESSNSTSLESRVENIERMLSRIESQLSELPNLVATGVDTVDSLVGDAQDRGVDIDERLQKAAHLLERLTDPTVSDTLEKGLDLAENLSPTAAAAADTLDGIIRDAQNKGMDVDERLSALISIIEMATRPNMVSAIKFAVDAADQAPGLVAMFVDGLDRLFIDFQDRGVELHETIDGLLDLVATLGQPGFVRSINRLLAVTSEQALETTELIAASMAEASQSRPPKLGLLGMARVMRRPESKLVVGFTANLVANLGEKFNKRFPSNKMLDK